MKRLLAFVALCATLSAQSSTPIAYPDGLFQNRYSIEAQAIPISPSVITTRNLIWGGGWMACATALTVTITDGNGTAITPGGVALSASTLYSLNLLAGAYFSGGFSISASGTGCKYHAFWRQ